MTGKNVGLGTTAAKRRLASDTDLLRTLMQTALQEILEGKMSEHLGAANSVRTSGRTGY